MFDFVEFKARLIKTGFATKDGIVGCDEESVAKLERLVGKSLPRPYRNFLKTCGVKSDGFWGDIQFRIDELIGVNEDFLEDIRLLRVDGNDIALPNDAFAISTLRREQYMYVLLNTQVDTCPIFHFDVDLQTHEKRYDSLLEMLENGIQNYEIMAERRNEYR